MYERDCNQKCDVCEMCNENYEITLVDKKGYIHHKRYIRGVKCMKYGQIAFTLLELPKSTITDNVIFR